MFFCGETLSLVTSLKKNELATEKLFFCDFSRIKLIFNMP